jgi:predicted  nucleic acid-binding Zn ribbon protein
MAKKVPNPFGKEGCQEHKDLINEIANEKLKNGYSVVREQLIRLWNGAKRYVDLAVFKNGVLEQLHQVGVANKNGTPVSRERRVIKELEKETGIKVIFHAYKYRIISTLLLILCGLFYWL